MDLTHLLSLIVAVENDPLVEKVKFLTDGDPDDHPATLKALVDYLDATPISRADSVLIEEAGYTSYNEDCICFITKKGIVNTGSDNF